MNKTIPLATISILATLLLVGTPTSLAIDKDNGAVIEETDSCDASGRSASCTLYCLPGSSYRASITSADGEATVSFSCGYGDLSECSTDTSCTGGAGLYLNAPRVGTCSVSGSASITCYRVDLQDQVTSATESQSL